MESNMTESVYLGIDTSRPDGVGMEHLDLTFPQMVSRQAKVFGDVELIVDGETRLIYAEFEAQMTALSRAAIACGVETGDHVAVWAPNSARWLLAAFGASAAGSIIVPMNSRLKGLEAADIVERTEPRVLFTTRHFLDQDFPRMLRAAFDGEVKTRIVVLDGDAEGDDLTWEEFLAMGTAIAENDAIERRESISADSVSDIILTSGTTGRPKGVMTTHHQNMLAFTRAIKQYGLQTGERINATLPFFHNFGLKTGFLGAVLVGGTCICDSTFDPARLAALIERERITCLPATPTVFEVLVAAEARHDYDLGSLRHCLLGGSMIALSLVETVKSELCEHVLVGYGLSELAGAISINPPDADALRVAQWSGQVVEGVEVRVVDGSGNDVAPGEQGEILARSECVMVGYLDDASATSAAIDAEGWLHTGDIGIVDDEQYIRITDRKKDVYSVGGFNTYPAEIERYLLMHPQIAQVAVIGAPDDRLGEVGVAFVVPKPDSTIDTEEVIAWSKTNMSNYKVPRHVIVVDELPMNASMKVVKGELRQRLEKLTLS